LSSGILEKLVDRTLTPRGLFQKVYEDSSLIPDIVDGLYSTRASVRYGCAKVLTDLSCVCPEKLYPFMDSFIDLLDSRYRILVWNAMAIIANLAPVDRDRKFDEIFDKYYDFMNDEYMATVANVVGNSGRLALAKPHLIDKITDKLLEVENLRTTPHMTKECTRVIAEKVIDSLDMFFDRIEQKRKVVSFVEKYVDSSRKTLREAASDFLEKWA
jgi:hypothetical protein